MLHSREGRFGRLLLATVSAAALMGAVGSVQAQEAADSNLADRVEQMERELQVLKAELRKATEKARAATAKAEAAQKQADSAAQKAAQVSQVSPIEKLPDTQWHLAGYMATGLVVSNSPDQEDTFVSGQFNPMFHFQYKDLVLFESEAEIAVEESGETEFELEYSQANIFLNDNATFVVGKFLSPVGEFQERVHPAWIKRLADKPAGFGHDGLQPATEVGIQLRGGVPVGKSVLTYVVGVGNGPRMNNEGGVVLEGFGSDDNSNKSIMGRIGFLPVPYIEVGASFLTAKVSGLNGTVVDANTPAPTNADFTLWGVDANYTRGAWDLRFEYLNGKRDSIFSALPFEEEGLAAAAIRAQSGGDEEAVPTETEVTFLPDLDMEAWYAQAAYRLAGITDRPVLKNFEPVVRYSEFHIKGLDELRDEAAENRFDIGLNYWLAPSIVVHSSIQWRDFAAVGRETERRFQLKFGYGF